MQGRNSGTGCGSPYAPAMLIHIFWISTDGATGSIDHYSPSEYIAMLQDYDTSFSRVYFSPPPLFSTPASSVPTFFSSVVARSSSLYRLSFDRCQVQAAVPYTPHLRVKFAPCG
ncbi:hypothetical protein TNCV_4580251 [Trichonephila clavipes]|nr:hypothetical protein TNCV_4580251 [Trichonephila clavipes]